MVEKMKVKDQPKWKDLFGLRRRHEDNRESFGYGALLVEEAYHAVGMHTINYIITMLTKHNRHISEELSSFFLTDVKLSEYFFGFSDNSGFVRGSACSFERRAILNKWDIKRIYESPRKHIRAYEVTIPEEENKKMIYIDIDLSTGKSFHFTKEENRHLFKVFHNRDKLLSEFTSEGISEKDFKALTLSYAWNLVMCIQEICIYRFGEYNTSNKKKKGFRRIVTWANSRSKERLLVYKRDDLVMVPETQFISFARPYAENGKLHQIIDMFCSKIAHSMYKYEQIHMGIPLDWMSRTDRKMHQPRGIIDRITREMHTWFLCNGLYETYGDCIENMILSPLRISDILKPMLIETYEVGGNYAEIYHIIEPGMKANWNKDYTACFDGTPLYSEDNHGLNLVCIYSSELNLKDTIGLADGTESIHLWIHLWAQIFGVLYQKNEIRVDIENEKLKNRLASSAINGDEVLSAEAAKRIILSRAKQYANQIEWRIRNGIFPSNDENRYSSLNSHYNKIMLSEV